MQNLKPLASLFTEQASLSLTWSKTLKTGFLVTWLVALHGEHGRNWSTWGKSTLVLLCDMPMSLVTRKPVLGVCYQVRHKPVCTATEARQRFEILDTETRGIISRQRTTKALIRLHGCAGWSAPPLFAYSIKRFSHDMAQIHLFLF